jgi:hypothetical protein
MEEPRHVQTGSELGFSAHIINFTDAIVFLPIKIPTQLLSEVDITQFIINMQHSPLENFYTFFHCNY